MFGLLTLDAFKHDIVQTAGVVMIIGSLLGAVGLLFYFKKWNWLWKEYLSSLDPKKIGVMYLTFSIIMLFKGVSDAAMIRLQQIMSVGGSQGYLSADHFQQVFTAHGATMIFFVGMGFIFGFMNLIVPLQIGARDVAFPFLNAISFYLFVVGGSLLILSMIIGDFAATGWVAYPPLSGIKYSPGTGVDYWIWSVQIAGVGSLLAGINFFVTILKMRCPGMTLMKMPLFTWSALTSVSLVILAFPILTATVGMLTLDRMLGMHFFTAGSGGNPMMYINLIWAWGHPEVYILVLPAFGVYSEVVATFSGKRLFGYTSMVWALGAITILSFIVWLHHFFTMGAGGNVNAFFGIMTMLIAIPTGAKVFNWLFTMYRGKIRFTTPMLWFMGFTYVFVTGGMTGMLLSIAPVDFQTHNSLFLVAHFHSMVIGGVLFAFFAAVDYWFPKIIGFQLNETWGKIAFYFWIFGFTFAFMPLYALGLMGATRRLDHYDASTGWQPLFIVAAFGAGLILIGIGCQVMQLLISIIKRKENRDLTGDLWNGRTLEWSIPSPPPIYNFAVTPEVHDIDAFWEEKQKKTPKSIQYEDIFMPKNSGIPVVIGAFSFLLGFALIWQILWMGLISLVGIIVFMIIRLSEKETEECFTAKDVEKIELELSSRT
jgi:cytochrome o ubiquinol oxidase subunit I